MIETLKLINKCEYLEVWWEQEWGSNTHTEVPVGQRVPL